MIQAPTSPAHASDADAIALLHDLVSIPSPSCEEHSAVAHLVTSMSRLGLDARIDEVGNAIGIRASRPLPDAPSRDLVLLGHIDTFPGAVPIRREGDLLFGRGTVDAKGPLAAFAIAAATASLPRDVRVIVAGAIEEECATSRGARHIARCFHPSACIIGEPSHWDGLTIGYKGRLLASLRIARPCSHSSGPEATAAELAIAWFNALRSQVELANHGQSRIFDQIQLGLRAVNSSSDGLTDTCVAHVGFRLPPGVEPGELETVCRRLVTDGRLECTGHEHAVLADRGNPVARALTNAIRDRGGKPTTRVKTGTSDMNIVAPIWQCPIAAYGPGDSALDHTPDEHISITEYLQSIDVLRTALESLAAELAAEPAASR